MRFSFSARRRGAALVEFALVSVFLIMVLFGVIEFSIYSSNTLRLTNATREGERAAAVGKPAEVIRSRVREFASPMPLADDAITLTYSHRGEAYQPLNNAEGGGPTIQNQAAPDDSVKVQVRGQNRSVTNLFGFLFNRALKTEVVMRRESN